MRIRIQRGISAPATARKPQQNSHNCNRHDANHTGNPAPFSRSCPRKLVRIHIEKKYRVMALLFQRVDLRLERLQIIRHRRRLRMLFRVRRHLI